MNEWANDQNRNHDWIPVPQGQPKIEVRDSSVYRNSWKVANLVQTDSTDPEDFKEVQATLEAHFKVRHPSPTPRPSTVPDVPDESFVDLLPDDPDLWPDDNSLSAKEIPLDFEIPDKTKSRLERCKYLNRLLSRKLDLDFDLAWKEFSLKRADLFYPISPDYEDSVYVALQKACSDFDN